MKSVEKNRFSWLTNEPANVRQTALFFSLIGLLMVLSFMIGLFSQQLFGFPGSSFSLLRDSFQILKDHSLKDLPDQKQLEYGMIRGMLQVYNDPYTVFVEPPQNKLQSDQLQGKFGGIGVRLEKDAQKFYILYPLPDSPALKSGMKDGDRLLSVEKLTIFPDTTVEEVQAAIRGPVGKAVNLEVGRAPDFKPVKLSINRMEVAVPSVTFNLAANDLQVGVIQVNLIAATGPDEIRKAIKELTAKGATKFILDLRNNGGGLVDAGVDISRLFLKDGIIIQEQFHGESVTSYKVEKPGEFVNLPIEVLVNQNTASAAEIVSGALQSQHRALLIGGHTFGKDVVQMVFDLRDGSSIHVTAGKWWLPDKPQGIGKVGLQPDVQLQDDVINSAAAIDAAITVFSR
jgi:carboxyl-terminal processing protease